MTDVEFTELRYSGKAAAVLRVFRAIYLGLFMNAIVMGWVHKAMEKIFKITIPDFDPFLLIVIVALIIAVHASASGLLGTACTDSFQFIFAMGGTILLAVIVVQIPQIGGLVSLKEKLAPQILDFLPRVGNITLDGITGEALALSASAFFASACISLSPRCAMISCKAGSVVHMLFGFFVSLTGGDKVLHD